MAAASIGLMDLVVTILHHIRNATIFIETFSDPQRDSADFFLNSARHERCTLVKNIMIVIVIRKEGVPSTGFCERKETGPSTELRHVDILIVLPRVTNFF